MSKHHELEKKIGYQFNRLSLLETALTHRSKTNEMPGTPNNERLEFLGDAVMEMVVSHLLFLKFKHAQEGELSRLRSAMVNETALANKAKLLLLGSYLHLGQGEEKSKGREKNSILANALEAVIAAIYLDGGMDAAYRFVEEQFSPDLSEDRGQTSMHEYKTELQEYCQKWHQILPRYSLLEMSGPEHERTYQVTVQVGEKNIATGKGRSKKLAEQDAAKQALQIMHEIEHKKTK